MKDTLKNLLPRSVRAAINDLIKDRVEEYQREEVHKLKQKVEKLEAEMYQVYPDNIIFDDWGRALIEQFKEEHKRPELNTTISKNDLMYQYVLLHVGNANETLGNYLNTGYSGAQIFSKIAHVKFHGLSEVNAVLDFASGYGRLTRFLIQDLAPEKIWVSDVKSSAVEWQIHHFGVHGFNSSFVPEEIHVDQKFDIIFVGSLFSHLPDKVFARWINTLYGLLSDRGVLAITVHDSSLLVEGKDSDYLYAAQSEDDTFRSVPDRIQSVEEYGITYVSEQYVSRSLESVGIRGDSYTRYPREFGGTQDMYCINKGENPFSADSL